MTGPTAEARVRAAFRRQAEACRGLDSPFMARLCALAAERLVADTAVSARVLSWPGEPSNAGDSVPLRLAGGLHALVLTDADARLRAAYPPHGPEDDDALWEAVTGAFTRHEKALDRWLDSPPQTNEVRRSSALLPGFLAIAARTGLALELLEVGASAGLNLCWDRYRHTVAGHDWGPADSPVRLNPQWRGAPARPVPAAVPVAARAGCDLNPLDAAAPADRLRLLSYLWPDQPERIARTRAALDMAAAAGIAVERADAVEWLECRLAAPATGRARVVYHTIAWQYLPEAARRAGEAVIAEAGSRASAEAPLFRLAMEADGGGSGAGLHLTAWPPGETRPLGRADFHGRWVAWQG